VVEVAALPPDMLMLRGEDARRFRSALAAFFRREARR
jgi:hypothetical protein